MLNLWESMQTPLNFVEFWFWKSLGFLCSWAFLWICWIWSVTEWREKVKSVCWCGAWSVDLFFLILTLCSIYKLPCGIWSNELVTCGPEHLAWQSGLFWLKDRNAIWKTLRTEMQLKLGLKCKKWKVFGLSLLKELGLICKKI